MNIQVKLSGNSIKFIKYESQIDKVNLNNTNVINDNNLIFSKQYIEKNFDILFTFLNLIVLKKNINTAIISNNELAVIVLPIINKIDVIENITFLEDKELSYTISSLLLENLNLKHIECYSMPEIMYYRFNKDVIKARCSVLFKSDFMRYNNINTYSDLYNKDKITIDSCLTTYDVDDIMFFINTNKNLRKIVMLDYNKTNLLAFLKIIKEKELKKITIIINQNDTNLKSIMDDIKYLEKLSKDYEVNIKIKYSKKYINKNRVRELNLELCKVAILFIFIINTFLFFGYRILLMKNSNGVDDVNNRIQTIIDNNLISEPNSIEDNNTISTIEDEPSHNTSPYYMDYSKIYGELSGINSDTIGWLSVNNTKINYPVVQSSDNDYYLNHAFDRSSNIIGWVFADYRNNFDKIDKNTIIYGHSMVDGGHIFTTLQNVLKSSWYTNENNLYIKFSIKENEYNWRIFSIYVIENTNDYLYTNFSSDDDFIKFINKITERSVYNFNQNIEQTDNILTLSTCYKDSNHRLVVHAVLR